MDVQGDSQTRSGVAIPARRILCLGLVAGYIDALGYLDLNGIYTAAMTGNTVQFGIALAHGEWAHFVVVAAALAAFFCGGLLSSVIRRRLAHPAVELLVMAGLVLLVQIVRLFGFHRAAIELPLLAVAMAMQGETISRFGGMAIQTIVVTSNLLKCADGVVGLYLSYRGRHRGCATRAAGASMADFVLPGCAWLSYTVGAGSGALGATYLSLALAIPIVVLLIVTGDLLSVRPS